MKDERGEIVVAVSGYFDPIHKGHLEYIELAKELGDKLIVILNNDKQAVLKKGKSFIPLEERKIFLESLKFVDEVFISIDEDKSVCKSLELVAPDIFAKGGDRFSSEIPEAKICKRLGIKVVDNLGKKIQSSSSLLKNYNKPEKVEKPWGSYTVLKEEDFYKIKIIEVEPKKRLSLQKHKHRSEHWIVVSGIAKVTLRNETKTLHTENSIYIPKNTLHRVENDQEKGLKIIEIQNGRYLEEDDIERFEDDYNRC